MTSEIQKSPLLIFKLILIGAMFILGFYFIFAQAKSEMCCKEGFDGDNNKQRQLNTHCPNVLIQKGNMFYLFNTNRAKVPGVNPLQFNSLDEYVEFTDWQRSQGIRCPIMYLQESYDAQGNAVLKYRPSPTNIQGGLQDLNITSQTGNKYSDLVNSIPINYGVNSETQPPKSELLANISESETKLLDASRDDYPYNKGDVSAFDPKGQYQGINTPLDKMFHSNESISVNPMDTNWGGIKYTQDRLKKGEIVH